MVLALQALLPLGITLTRTMLPFTLLAFMQLLRQLHISQFLKILHQCALRVAHPLHHSSLKATLPLPPSVVSCLDLHLMTHTHLPSWLLLCHEMKSCLFCIVLDPHFLQFALAIWLMHLTRKCIGQPKSFTE
jgi:hypothetical protein